MGTLYVMPSVVANAEVDEATLLSNEEERTAVQEGALVLRSILQWGVTVRATISLYISISIYISIFLSRYISISIYISIFLSIYLYLSIYLSLCLSLSVCVSCPFLPPPS